MITFSITSAKRRSVLSTVRSLAVSTFTFVIVCQVCLESWSQENSLRQVIDSHFSNDLPKPALAGDAEFARRVSIDLTGMPPSVDQLKEFLEDKSADKREKWVKELITTPQFERRLATFLDVMLMERRQYKDVKEAEWTEYVLAAVRANKPWNDIAREILAADGLDEPNRPAVRFALARDAEPNLLTRDIGRVFFGKDLQCAQCHDHPLVEDYLQADYQGLLAFVAPGYIKTIQRPGPKTKDGKPGKPVSVKIYAEKAGNDISFESVFVKDTKHRTGPRLIGEKSNIEPDLLPVSTTATHRPQNSRRTRMSTQATSGRNRAFNENMANRLWALMMGRGLVDPPDFHHRDNAPIKPALMRDLGDHLVKLKFDMRQFLVEIALSNVYQRAYELPALASKGTELENRMKQLKEKQKQLSQEIEAVQVNYKKAIEEFSKTESQLIPVALNVEKQQNEYSKIQSGIAKLKAEADKAVQTRKQQHEIRDLIADMAVRVQKVNQQLADDETKKLDGLIAAKLKKVQASAVAADKKAADAGNNWNAGVKSLEKTKTDLLAGFAKRKPIRAELDQKESLTRKWRTQMEELVSSRAAIESEIATVEKLIAFESIESQISKMQPEASGEIENELINEKKRLENSLSIRLAQRHVVSSLRPLSPEQLAWSTFKVTGFYQRYWAAEEGKLRKEQGLKPDKELDRDQLRLLEERTFKVLKGHLNNFIRYYAAGAGQPQGDFFATADQALFAANSGSLNSYLNPSAGNVTDRMLKSETPETAARELYLAVLSRLPTADEIQDVDNYLRARSDDKKQAVMELAWGLLNSAEFRFNH